MEYVNTFNYRTGEHSYLAIEMPDGKTRAVWPVHDGPTFDGYYTAEVGGKVRRTTRADYDEYQRR